MHARRILPMLLVAPAWAQTQLLGVRANGDLLRIDPASGAARLVGSGGVPCDAAVTYSHIPYRSQTAHDVLIGGSTPPNRLTALDRWTGQPRSTIDITGLPAGHTIRAIANGPLDYEMFVILGPDDPTAVDLFASVSLYWSTCTVIGPTGRSDIDALTRHPSGVLYGLGANGGGTLLSIDPSTGAATPIGGGGFGGDILSIASLPDGTLLACGANLLAVNPATGAATLIGPTGFSDIRGLTVVVACYPDCTDGAPPPLNVADFGCFINVFAAGHPYANCDDSTTPPVLTIQDFMCFLNSFAAGCSAF